MKKSSKYLAAGLVGLVIGAGIGWAKVEYEFSGEQVVTSRHDNKIERGVYKKNDSGRWRYVSGDEISFGTFGLELTEGIKKSSAVTGGSVIGFGAGCLGLFCYRKLKK